MSILEQRYRTILRLLPASYRAAREEEMVASFLDSVGEVSDADDPKPGWSETASVAALALRVRLGDTGGGPSGSCGPAVRLVGLLGLLYQAAVAVWSIVTALRVYTGLGLPNYSGHYALSVMGAPGSADRLGWVGWIIVDVAVIIAYVTLVRGHRRTGKILVLLLLAYPIAGVARSIAVGPTPVGYQLLGTLLTVITVLALLIGFHRGAPR